MRQGGKRVFSCRRAFSWGLTGLARRALCDDPCSLAHSPVCKGNIKHCEPVLSDPSQICAPAKMLYQRSALPSRTSHAASCRPVPVPAVAHRASTAGRSTSRVQPPDTCAVTHLAPHDIAWPQQCPPELF